MFQNLKAHRPPLIINQIQKCFCTVCFYHAGIGCRWPPVPSNERVIWGRLLVWLIVVLSWLVYCWRWFHPTVLLWVSYDDSESFISIAAMLKLISAEQEAVVRTAALSVSVWRWIYSRLSAAFQAWFIYVMNNPKTWLPISSHETQFCTCYYDVVAEMFSACRVMWKCECEVRLISDQAIISHLFLCFYVTMYAYLCNYLCVCLAGY